MSRKTMSRQYYIHLFTTQAAQIQCNWSKLKKLHRK